MVRLPHSLKRELEMAVLAGELSETGRKMFDDLMECRKIIKDRVLEDLDRTGTAERLSPAGYLEYIRCPVYLLHGKYDPTVSWEQTSKLKYSLLASGKLPERYRISDSFSHVEPERVKNVGEQIKDLLFFASVLENAY
jgi:hypothetical protein